MSGVHADHAAQSTRRLVVAVVLNLGFAGIEIVGGLWTGSSAILADAVHDLGDASALGFALILERIARRRPDRRFSFGYRRFSLLGALINAGILVIGSILVAAQAIPKLLVPIQPHTQGMAALAVLGIIVNGVAVATLRGGRTLNERVASWHLLEDVLGWIAVLIVAGAMSVADVPRLDPLLSLVIGGYILWNAAANLRATLMVFLQGVPSSVDVEAVEDALRRIEHVGRVYHTHVWSQDGEHHVLTTHVVLDKDISVSEAKAIADGIRGLLKSMGIQHATIEFEAGKDIAEKHPWDDRPD